MLVPRSENTVNASKARLFAAAGRIRDSDEPTNPGRWITPARSKWAPNNMILSSYPKIQVRRPGSSVRPAYADVAGAPVDIIRGTTIFKINFAGRSGGCYSADYPQAGRWGETILVRLCRRAWRELSDILFVHPRNKPIAAIEHVKANQRVALERVRKSGQLAKGIFLHSEFKAGTDASAFER